MKKILIIAGPNGAGKTTFAQEFLPNEACCLEFVNADLIAAGLSPFQPDQASFTAGRLMLGRIKELVAAEKSFAFETTLSSPSYARYIPQWQNAGYLVKLYFLTLPDPDFAIRRVERRVRQGGHHIPSATIRRRFQRGIENLNYHYLGVVDEWTIYDGSVSPPLTIDSSKNNPPHKLMEDSIEYLAKLKKTSSAQPIDDTDFIGATAALKRAAAKAVARDLADGLEPIVRTLPDAKTNSPS